MPNSLLETTDGKVLSCTRTSVGDGEVFEICDVTTQIHLARAGRSDPLTGLANRDSFRLQLAETLAGLAPDATLAVHAIDLDRFKSVNDSLGHPVGDALLKIVADRVATLLAPKDVLARLGGDEFAILQRVAEPGEAEALAARLVDFVGRAYLVRGHMISIGASAGIALAPMHGNTPEVLIKSADLALFAAKADGRGTFRTFDAAWIWR